MSAAQPGALPAEAQSPIIGALTARRSVLPDGSSFDRVATAVLAANSRTAEAELRAARLRAEAQSKNWLPTLGPVVSLTSLGQVLAQLVIDQVLFDNGRRQAERDFAKADVEVAAVTLATDTNDRVYTALSLYILAEEAREKAALHAVALQDMAHFAHIMERRVEGGISDNSDLNILRQKLAEIRSAEAASRETAAASLAELNAMSVQRLDGVTGLAPVPVNATGVRALAVMQAEAEKERSVAGAKAERAGQLPSLGAQAIISKTGTDAGLTVQSETPLGFGTPAALRAITAATEAAGRRVAQAQEDSNRALARLMQEAAALDRQTAEAAGLTQQAKTNLDLFQAQYDAGQRQVMDVVGVYETYARAAQSEATLKYRAALIRLEMARDLGLLADGSAI
jgi:adhesin transport system outer membrane protein